MASFQLMIILSFTLLAFEQKTPITVQGSDSSRHFKPQLTVTSQTTRGSDAKLQLSRTGTPVISNQLTSSRSIIASKEKERATAITSSTPRQLMGTTKVIATNSVQVSEVKMTSTSLWPSVTKQHHLTPILMRSPTTQHVSLSSIIPPPSSVTTTGVSTSLDEFKLCMLGTQASTQECANKTSALGMANGTITDSDITSSSVLNSSYAKFARLGRGKAWIPTNTDGHSWIQVNLQRLINITGLATQGLVFKDKNAFIRSYYLSHGDINGTNWMNYTIQGKTKVFQANTDATSVVRNDFSPSIKTAYIRLHPIKCSHLCALRMEIYGCTEGLPGRPPRPNAVSILPTSINVTWGAPDDVGDGITGYNVQWKDVQTSRMFKVVTGKKFAILDTLSPYTTYSIKIQAFNGKGESLWSLPVNYKTAESVPSVAPSNFKLNSERSLTLEVAWSAIPEKQQRGELLGYRINYTNERSGIENIIDVGPDKIVYTITGLEFTSYAVKLAGYTGAGVGIFTDILKRFPLEGAPSPPRNIQLLVKTSSSIQVSWEEPEEKNGNITTYIVSYGKGSLEAHVNTTETKYLLDDLEAFTLYSVQVTAKTSILGYHSVIQKARTMEAAPGKPTEVTARLQPGGSIRVAWKDPQVFNGIIISYQIYFNGKREYDPKFQKSSKTKIARNFRFMEREVDPGTEYTVYVTASTSIGEGNRSDSIIINTPAKAPGEPRGVTAKLQSDGSIRVEWKEPEVLNGEIISYQIYFKGKREYDPEFQKSNATKISSEFRFFEIMERDLDPGTEYTVYMTASTSSGEGNRSDSITINTPAKD
ncbi:tyrosine-protein phosphatase Lar-like isoform X3 [Acropora muricata]|uniref:tyrosine-protein phosphatase Lar-like isoform X3 n=1 Tax=Acropora muricata TaxID=159855 RepID=UPI0034E3DB7C